MLRFCKLAIGVLITAVFLQSSAFSQSRVIRLNGAYLTANQAYQLDNLVGTRVPNGAYWLDFRTWIWGYEGNPAPQGQLNLRGRDTEPGYNIRTPGGDLMSDGNCAFIAGVPVGKCD